jgi:hypothetical protein
MVRHASAALTLQAGRHPIGAQVLALGDLALQDLDRPAWLVERLLDGHQAGSGSTIERLRFAAFRRQVRHFTSSAGMTGVQLAFEAVPQTVRPPRTPSW